MKTSHNRQIISIVLLALLFAPFPAAAQTAEPSPQAQTGQSQQAGEESAFIRDNLPTFQSFTLSNGIPVYLKVNKANRVLNLSLVLRGGSLTTPSEKAGWPNLALKTMARASSKYSYEHVIDLLDATSSSVSTSTLFEYSTFSLNVLDKYFDRLLPVWGDMIMAPAFAQSDFDQAKSEVELTIQSKEQSPWSLTQKLMNEKYFEGHPYGVNPDGTEATIGAATAQDMRQWYDGTISADRVFVVAVGDFTVETLKPALEEILGGMPNLSLGPVKAAPAFGRAAPGKLFTEPYEQSKGVVYIRGDFAAPSSGEKDFMAANLAAELYSDLLFAVVRGQYGAVYSPGANIRAYSANYGSISMYKASATDKIKSYIDEAAGIFASGRCVSVDPTRPGDEAKFMKISDALESYKSMFINRYFASVRTNAEIAGLMVRSVVQTGNPADWVYDVKRIAAVTPDEVVTAFRTYMLDGAFTWVAVGDETLLDKLEPKDFEGFAVLPQ